MKIWHVHYLLKRTVLNLKCMNNIFSGDHDSVGFSYMQRSTGNELSKFFSLEHSKDKLMTTFHKLPKYLFLLLNCTNWVSLWRSFFPEGCATSRSRSILPHWHVQINGTKNKVSLLLPDVTFIHPFLCTRFTMTIRFVCLKTVAFRHWTGHNSWLQLRYSFSLSLIFPTNLTMLCKSEFTALQRKNSGLINSSSLETRLEVDKEMPVMLLNFNSASRQFIPQFLWPKRSLCIVDMLEGNYDSCSFSLVDRQYRYIGTDSLHTGFGDAWADIIRRSSLLVLYIK